MVKKLLSFIFILVIASIISINFYFKKKELESSYTGISKLNSKFLDNLIENSNLSFFSNNHKKIVKSLLSNPLISSVEVGNCKLYSLKCYVIDLNEADPLFSLITEENSEKYIFSTKAIQLWTGNLEEGLPDYLKNIKLINIKVKKEDVKYYLNQSSLSYIKNLIKELKKKDLEDYTLNLYTEDKFKLLIKDLDFPIIFSFTPGKIEIFNKEFQRFEKILNNLNDKLAEISAINMSFNRLGSVVMK